jgi:hypothetical protein
MQQQEISDVRLVQWTLFGDNSLRRFRSPTASCKTCKAEVQHVTSETKSICWKIKHLRLLDLYIDIRSGIK